MLNYAQITKHPETGKWEVAIWYEGRFIQGDRRSYGVVFPDGKMFDGNTLLGETLDNEVSKKEIAEAFNREDGVGTERFAGKRRVEHQHDEAWPDGCLNNLIEIRDGVTTLGGKYPIHMYQKEYTARFNEEVYSILFNVPRPEITGGWIARRLKEWVYRKFFGEIDDAFGWHRITKTKNVLSVPFSALKPTKPNGNRFCKCSKSGPLTNYDGMVGFSKHNEDCPLNTTI